ncbi:hypothetical protein B0H13DRAFT_2316728 [Mycena leptocephala]|nr:hypothetical protein B0H13DRAFT_2316728 [Mycena leptocephala]
MARISQPRTPRERLQGKGEPVQPPKALTAPFSTNLKIRRFIGNLQRLSDDIDGDEQSSGHIVIWPHPIGFSNGTKRLNWVKELPYLAEYSYFTECFRKKAPGRMWMGLFVTAIESWVGKKVLAERHIWAAIIISPEAPATGKKLLIYDCDGKDVDFRYCCTREALPLSIQRDLWGQKKMPFMELWRSSYNLETCGQNQCMKYTCEFLIHAVRSPPHVTVGPDGEEIIDGFIGFFTYDEDYFSKQSSGEERIGTERNAGGAEPVHKGHQGSEERDPKQPNQSEAPRAKGSREGREKRARGPHKRAE